MSKLAYLLILSCIYTNTHQLSYNIVQHVNSVARLNCLDQSFMDHGGCGGEQFALEVSELVISITNCVLTSQLKHLELKAVLCAASDRDCLSLLDDKQKETLMLVMTNMGIYCEVFHLRKTRYIKDQFIRSLSETSDIVKETLEQVISAHELLHENFETALSEVKNLSNIQANDTSAANLLKSSSKLLEEVSSMDMISLSQPLDLRYLGSLVDMYTYVMAFFFKIFVIVINSAIMTSGFIDISMSSMIGDLVAGIVIDLLIGSLTEVMPVRIIVSDSYLILARLVVFGYFGMCGFLIKAFKSRKESEAENNLLHGVVSVVKQMLNEDENLFGTRHNQKGKYQSYNSYETQSRSKRISLIDRAAVVPAVLEPETYKRDHSLLKPVEERVVSIGQFLDENSNLPSQEESGLHYRNSVSKSKNAHNQLNITNQAPIRNYYSDSMRRNSRAEDFHSPIRPN